MSMIFTNEVRLGDSTLDGQVVLLDNDRINLHAPTKAKPWFKLDIAAALAPEGAPNKDSIDWLVHEGVRVYVLLQLPDATLDLSRAFYEANP